MKTAVFFVIAALVSPTAWGGDHGTIKFNVPGCRAEDDARMVQSALADKDFQAIMELLTSGRCINLPEGQQVIRIDSSFGYMKVRKPGSADGLWVFSEAVKLN